jgi:hypothetical protein
LLLWAFFSAITLLGHEVLGATAGMRRPDISADYRETILN